MTDVMLAETHAAVDVSNSMESMALSLVLYQSMQGALSEQVDQFAVMAHTLRVARLCYWSFELIILDTCTASEMVHAIQAVAECGCGYLVGACMARAPRKCRAVQYSDDTRMCRCRHGLVAMLRRWHGIYVRTLPSQVHRAAS